MNHELRNAMGFAALLLIFIGSYLVIWEAFG